MDFILGELSSSRAQKLALWEVTKREALKDESEMKNASKQLKFLLAGGTWPNMVSRITALLEKKQIKVHFIVLLKLNIETAQNRGWKNKIMLFEKLEELINNYRTKGTDCLAVEKGVQQKKKEHSSETVENVAVSGGGFGMHAPVFESPMEIDKAKSPASTTQDSNNVAEGIKSLLIGSKISLDVTQTHEIGCVDGKLLATSLKGGNDIAKRVSKKSKRKGRPSKGGNKKKVKRADKEKSKIVLDSIAKALDANGWSICDNFVSIDLIQKIREEIDSLEPHFEQSEIWVGKGSSSIGAHLRVPSVRGDKVSKVNIGIPLFHLFTEIFTIESHVEIHYFTGLMDVRWTPRA